ncbi:MAG: hypothetical protein AB6733_20565 [Clostridiaceae bacterium]
MNDKVLCLIEFLRDKNCLYSRNKIILAITLILGMIMDIMLFITFREFIENNKINHKFIVSGYFIVTIILYLIASLPDKLKNLDCIKLFFVLPINYKDIFFSIIFYGFFSYISIPFAITLCIPAFLFAKSILNLVLLLVESLLIVFIAELVALVLSEIFTCMKLSKIITFLSIGILASIVLVVKIFSSELISVFGVSYLQYNIRLIIVGGVLVYLLYKVSYLLFNKYKYLFQDN